MPYKSEKQRRYMKGCEHNRAAMTGKCPPKKVLKEYSRESKKRK